MSTELIIGYGEGITADEIDLGIFTRQEENWDV